MDPNPQIKYRSDAPACHYDRSAALASLDLGLTPVRFQPIAECL